MYTRSNRSLPLLARWCAIVAVCGLGCGHDRRFVAFRQYGAEHFSGSNLSGRSISITPLLTIRGALTAPSTVRQIREIKKQRKDLKILSDDYRKPFTDKSGEEPLDSIYAGLFRGDMIALQNAGEFWKSVAGDYLMALKLTRGFTVLSSDSAKERRIRLEGELWHCDSMEVVWRAGVEGTCAGGRESDEGCIESAVCRIFQALPSVKPGYGPGSW